MIYTVSDPPVGTGYQLPEGPRWHDGRLWFSDIRAGRVFCAAEDGRPEQIAQFDVPCSGIGFLADGTPLVTLMPLSRLVRIDGPGATALHADLADLGGTHVNDMVSDAAGRCYVNLLSYPVDWAAPERLPGGGRRIPFAIPRPPPEVRDRIALVDPDGSHRVIADDVFGPNGMAVSAAGDRLVVSEWRARRVTAFRIDPQDGSLSQRSVLCELGEGGTDGLCLDQAGGVWCATPLDGQCVRITPDGQISDVARPLAGHHVMACVLGGADRRTLFMMTNRRPEPSTGAVETVRVLVPGAGRP
jgi:sugar lactone lactonase YvrE